jgi:hypothetical protein
MRRFGNAILAAACLILAGLASSPAFADCPAGSNCSTLRPRAAKVVRQFAPRAHETVAACEAANADGWYPGKFIAQARQNARSRRGG